MIPETQLEAFKDLQPKISDRHNTIISEIFKRGIGGGMTLFELEKALGWPINRISGRITELAKAGLVQDIGVRRENPASGKNGIVWYLSVTGYVRAAKLTEAK